MADIEEVGARLTLKDRRKFSSDADRAAKDINKISKAADKARKKEEQARREQGAAGVASLRGQAGGITSIARKMAGVSAVLGTTAGAAGVFGLRTASSLEQAEIGFTTMLGSAQKAQSFIGEMQAFAVKTPFQFTEVQDAAKRMLAFGFSAEKVLPTLTSIGDAAAALGTGSEGIQRMTTAIGQIKTKGRVQSQELLQLMEAGLPALEMLSERMGVSTNEVQDMVEKGLVPAGVAIEALTAEMDERYGGLMERQSKTLSGMYSNLKDAATLGLAKAFKPLTEELKFAMPGAIAGTGRAMDLLGVKMGFVAGKMKQWREDGTFTRVWEIAKDVAGDLASVWKGSMWPAIQDLTSALGGQDGLLGALGAARGILSWMADHPDAGKAIFEGMAIAITSWQLAKLIIGVRNAMIGLNVAMAANPIGLVIGATAALMMGLGLLYDKLNEGRPVWEKALAAMFPFMGFLMTVKNHLRDIGEFLGIIEKKKPAVYGPWPTGQSPNELATRKNNTLKKTLPRGPFPTLGVPAMATGGVVSSAGLSLVGERGPELLTLPRASRVDPLPDGGGSLGSPVSVTFAPGSIVTSDPERAATLVVQKIQDMAARK